MPKAKPAPKPVPTVAAYFAAKLGRAIDDPDQLASAPDFTITSGCGRDCAAAIDSAVALLAHVAASFGESAEGIEFRAGIVATVESVVQCYIYG